MYQAVIIACLINAPSQCVTLETQRWHETERACQSDAFAMAEQVHKYMSGYKASKWRCRFLQKGMLTQ